MRNPFSSAIRLLKYLYFKMRFKYIEYPSTIVDIRMLTPKYIHIEKGVIIWYNCRIEGVGKYNQKEYNPLIVIKSGVHIQQNVHITCGNSIVIGDNTCISASVTITDINHPYEDVNIPIEKQDIEIKSVCIGKDCKIYNGVIILPGVKIGNHVVVGANSVVTHDIPDYCVAVGSPAYIIKRYDFERNEWRKTDKEGCFIE